LVLTSLGLLTTDIVDALPFVGWARGPALLLVCSFFAAYGALADVYCVLGASVVRLGGAHVTGDTFSWPYASIGAVNALYFRLLLLSGALYLLSVSVVWSSPGGQWLTANQAWARLWVVPPGLAVLGFFGAFSFALHTLLLQCRTRAEQEIVGQLQTLYDNWKQHPDPGVETSISTLLKWRDSIRLERVWPTDFKAGAATILTLLIPMLEAIVKVVRSYI
jgi:hypothetical protein